MASKMKKTKKQRTHKVSSKAAKTRRIEKQAVAFAANKEAKQMDDGLTPWEFACLKRRRIRIAQGKPQAWAKRQSEESNYKSKGKNVA